MKNSFYLQTYRVYLSLHGVLIYTEIHTERATKSSVACVQVSAFKCEFVRRHTNPTNLAVVVVFVVVVVAKL